jgi:hypothetical protein
LLLQTEQFAFNFRVNMMHVWSNSDKQYLIAFFISETDNAGQGQRKERNNTNGYDSNAVMIRSVSIREPMAAKQILSELLAPSAKSTTASQWSRGSRSGQELTRKHALVRTSW